MSNLFKWLQFFADGGASGGDGGGEGAGSGVTSADAGQSTGVKTDDAGQRLQALGVPKGKAERYAAAMARRAKQGAQTQQSDDPPAETGKSDTEQTEKAEDNFDVEAALKHPRMQERIQSMMAERGKRATEATNAANEQMDKMAPLLELLGARYGVQAKDGQFDMDALLKAATADDYFFEDKALESGKSVQDVRSEWQQQQETQQQQRQARMQQLQEHFSKMQQQAEALKSEFPNFDLGAELKNPDFLRLTSPEVGFDVRKAFRAVHQDEIEKSAVEAAANQAKALAAKARADGQSRPKENGKGASTAAQPRGYEGYKEMFAKMSPEERLAYIKRPRR